MATTMATNTTTTLESSSKAPVVTSSDDSDDVNGAVVSRKSVCDLLHARPTNWTAVRKRAQEHVDTSDLPRDFVAQLFLSANPGPTVDDFEWFMVKFGATAGHFGFGANREEVDDDFTKRMFLRVIATHIDHVISSKNVFLSFRSSVAAKAIIDTFGDSEVVSEAVLYYVFDLVGEDSGSRDNVWEYFTTVLETYVVKIVENVMDTNAADNDKQNDWMKNGSKFLYGNLILALLEYLNDQQEECPFSVDHFVACLEFMKKHDPKILLHKNNNEDTILHLVLTKARHVLPSLADDSDDVSISSLRYQVVQFLVKENPELCLFRNSDNCLPIHLAMELKDEKIDMLISVLHDAAPQVAQMRCLISGLYPFQLAAENANDRPACDCYHCSTYHHRPAGVSVSSVYTLLRQCPHLIVDGSTSELNKKKEQQLSDASYIEVAREELRLSRKRLQLDRMSQDLEQTESLVTQKRKRLRGHEEGDDDDDDDAIASHQSEFPFLEDTDEDESDGASVDEDGFPIDRW